MHFDFMTKMETVTKMETIAWPWVFLKGLACLLLFKDKWGPLRDYLVGI